MSTRTVNKSRFPIGEYKYAMRNLKANYLLECKSLQKEKEKLDSVLDEVSLMNLCVYSDIYAKLMSYFSWDTEEDGVTFFLEKLDCNHIKVLSNSELPHAPLPPSPPEAF